MRVLLVGSGGREHALAWRISASPLLRELHCAPGNPGMAALARVHDVAADDVDGQAQLAVALGANLVVVGPEAPLVAGLADRLGAAGVPCFGPSSAAARIEGSKAFAKSVMAAAGVPTAAYTVCDTVAVAHAAIAEAGGRVVVKADGLAAGKGVAVCDTAAEAEAAVRACLRERRFGAAGARLLIEERLGGLEASLLALCDGERAVPLTPARDYKRAGDGDAGPNTGGMGAVSPVTELDEVAVADLVASVHQPVVDELARRGTPFRGCLYAGLMLTDDGPRVIEFNARFGDPEAQAILPRLDADLLPSLHAAAAGRLDPAEVPSAAAAACVTVVLAAGAYPTAGDRGTPIDGLADAAACEGVTVFHAGTAAGPDGPVTAGGRILNVSAVGDDVDEAVRRAYAAIERIHFDGMRFRHDIGAAAATAGGARV
jgi:phosphoribosylamine---glycine ligase